jgi:hypothetical protein
MLANEHVRPLDDTVVLQNILDYTLILIACAVVFWAELDDLRLVQCRVY